MVPLKYLINFWRILEMDLINCEINLDLNWSENCVIVANNTDQDATFSITDTKLCVPVVTLLTQDNAKLLEQLKSGLKRTINQNKYELKVLTERPNQYLDFLIDQVLKEQIDFQFYHLKTEHKEQVANDIIFQPQK